MNRLITTIILITLSINVGAKVLDKDELLNEFSGQYISISVGDKTYCIEATESGFSPINTIQECQKITDVSIMNKGAVCIEDDETVCKKFKRTSSGTYWGSENKIELSQSLEGLEKVFNKSNDNDSSENKGKEYYAKAKKYFKKKNYHKAYEWAKKSADLDYKGGYFGLGMAFLKGYGVEDKDKEQAIKWFRKAAEKGHTSAQFRLGLLLMFDNGSEAEKWYTKAADKGHLTSQNNLGYMYSKGMGSSIWGDNKKAYQYYLLAAKQGSGIAQYNVCLFHYKGMGGAKKSNKIAEKWCQKAVDAGYGKARSLLEKVKSR